MATIGFPVHGFQKARNRMRIAHLSDVHILDPGAGTRKAGYRFAAKLVSMGRRVDPRPRTERLQRALAHAKKAGAEHVVISGDLTEVGEEVEFRHVAEILESSGFPAESFTLVPGNHDAYTPNDAELRCVDRLRSSRAGAQSPARPRT